MIRSELVQLLAADNPALTQREVNAIIDTFFDEITKQLEAGGRVELRGFGSFTARSRGNRTGRNPRTGSAVAVTAKNIPHFKAGKEIRDRLNT